MQGLTLTLAVVFSFGAVTLRLPYALGVYAAALFWYPNYLMVSVGSIDISVGRIVIGVLLLRCLFDAQVMGKFKWSLLDTWVAISMFVYVSTILISGPFLLSLENRGGFLMDTWFVYIVTRLIVTDRTKVTVFIKCVSIILVPLAILAVFEAITGVRPFLLLSGWESEFFQHMAQYQPRWGLTRAMGPFSHPIMLGCGFAVFLPLIYYLRHQKNYWRSLTYVLLCIALIGALSSLSSGPWVMIIMVIICLALEKHKHFVKPLLICFLFSCIFVEIISNRPFYHVFASYANPLGGSGWHRAKLIDCAIEHFGEWWLIGYGDKDPGWGDTLGMTITDITNQFIWNAVRHGIWGLIVICGVLVTAFRELLSTYQKTVNPELKSLCWSFGSFLVSIIITWMSVAFFGQAMSAFYCILGIIGSFPYFLQYESGYESVR